MSFILNIDTAVETASVCLAENDHVIATMLHASRKDHAAWLHTAIQQLLKQARMEAAQLSAVAVSAGPGSYTGLRVGMAAAKGLCYALGIPMIAVNTLQMMAVAAKDETAELLCPMIDARRMEVFTAVFDRALNELVPSSNLILTETSLADLWQKQTICIFGNGSNKFRPLVQDKHVYFKEIEAQAAHMVPLSFLKFSLNQFADLAYAQPYYGKEFYSPMKHSF